MSPEKDKGLMLQKVRGELTGRWEKKIWLTNACPAMYIPLWNEKFISGNSSLPCTRTPFRLLMEKLKKKKKAFFEFAGSSLPSVPHAKVAYFQVTHSATFTFLLRYYQQSCFLITNLLLILSQLFLYENDISNIKKYRKLF